MLEVHFVTGMPTIEVGAVEAIAPMALTIRAIGSRAAMSADAFDMMRKRFAMLASGNPTIAIDVDLVEDHVDPILIVDQEIRRRSKAFGSRRPRGQASNDRGSGENSIHQGEPSC